MKRIVFNIVVGIMVQIGCGKVFSQSYNPVPVTGFNFDAICEGYPNVTLFTTGTMDLSNYVMYSQTFAASAGISGGIINSGTIVSAGNTYQLNAFNASNALHLTGGSGTLTLTTPAKFNSLSIAGFATEGNSNIQVVLNFTDGTTASFGPFLLQDWFFGGGAIYAGFGRISRVTAAPYNANGTPTDPRIYPLNITLACADKQKDLASITINHVSGAHTFIMAVSGNAPPTVTATGGTMCAGSSITLNSSVTTPGGTYSWSPGGATTASTSVSPAASTVYTLSYTLGGCVYTDTANVTVVPGSPIAVPSTSICPGSSTTLIATGATTYTWSPATGLSATTGASVTASPAVTTTYTITGTSAGGCTSTTTATVTVDPSLVITVPSDSVCIGGSAVLNATGATTYTWSPATGLSATTGASVTASPATTTTYTITGSDPAGCTGSTTATVTVLPTPDVTATPSTENVCDGQSTNIALSSSVVGTSFSWTVSATNVSGASNGAGPSIVQTLNSIAPPSGSVTYTITPVAAGCTGTPINVVVNVGSVVINSIDVTPILCAGGNSTLTINATGANQYSIDGGATFQVSNVFTVTAGTYNVVAGNTGGCQDSEVKVVTAPNALALVSSPDVILCTGQSTFISATATGGTSPYTYTWDNGLPAGNGHTVSPNVTTTYAVSVTDANGCGPVTENVTVTIRPALSVNASADVQICQGDIASVGAIASGGNGGPYSYTWTNNVNSSTVTGPDQHFSPNVTTTYYVTVSDGCSTPAAVDSLVVSILPAPAVQYSLDKTNGCAPLVVNFDHNLPGSTCSWDFGDGNTSYNCQTQHVFTEPGCYDIHLTVTGSNGCTNDTTVLNQVCVYALPEAAFSFAPQPASVFDPEIVFTNLTIGGSSYVWDFAGLGSSTLVHPTYAFPGDSGRYYQVCLSALSSQGCFDSTCHTLVIADEFLVYVPNAFTPNGDGINEVFLPRLSGTDPNTYEFYVFDRWGTVVFQSKDLLKGWDGTHNGIKSKEDVYVWKIKARHALTEEKREITGHVNLLR